MDVRQTMITIFRSGATQRINFAFSGERGRDALIRHVGPEHFNLVARALEHRDIEVVEMRSLQAKAMYCSTATFPFKANTFYLGHFPRSGRQFGALMVHEAVHAAFDQPFQGPN